MSNSEVKTVDISIGANMYGRIKDLPNTPAHVLAEFIDNAIQSFRDKREELLALDPNYRLRIEIKITWDDPGVSSITVKDNAGGIDAGAFERAFKLAVTPEDNTGLNEFGMGLKTAALWLGDVWSLRTTALNEGICRSVIFDLKKVLDNSLNELNVSSEVAENNEHYTIVKITSLHPRAPKQTALLAIKQALSSIYRKSLRNNEADIFLNGDKLKFQELEILNAPPTKKPDAQPIIWKKNIDFKFNDKYQAKGFIGLLKNMNGNDNGIVLLRRGRVICGEEVDGRYFPASIFATTKGTPRYKRIFGELELEGFDVSFNKNSIQNKDDLDVVMEALKEQELRSDEFDLINQAENYRVGDQQKRVNKIVNKHNRSKKTIVQLPTKHSGNIEPNNPTEVKPTIETVEESKLGCIEDTYAIRGKQYKLTVEFVNKGSKDDLVWLDVSNKEGNVVTCKINVKNEFFTHFQKNDEAIVALLKTLALAKFITKENGLDTTAVLFDNFNSYIKEIKV